MRARIAEAGPKILLLDNGLRLRSRRDLHKLGTYHNLFTYEVEESWNRSSAEMRFKNVYIAAASSHQPGLPQEAGA